jgi:hypothetical protein
MKNTFLIIVGFFYASFSAAGATVIGGPGAKVDAAAGVEVSVVQDVPGYNSWPMIGCAAGKLICAYSRGSAHTIDEGKRGVFARVSADGGKTWGPETCVVNDPRLGEVTIGKGVDNGGAMLLWVRNWGRERRHDLYRTADGVKFERISSLELDPMPIQITDVFKSSEGELMSLWFAGNYRKGGSNSWGTVVSRDNGRTWVQRTVESGLEKSEWPTEQSAVNVGGGRILAVARSEGGGKPQFQLTSADGGRTWKRYKTKISDVLESTPSLIYNPADGTVANYYYHRGARKMKRRTVKVDEVFDNPLAWPAPEELAAGHEKRAYDAGNVNAVEHKGRHHLAFYTGTDADTTVFTLAVDPPAGTVGVSRASE